MTQQNIDFFVKYGYCVVQNAVSSELRDFITQYALFDEMQDFHPDITQVKGAHSKYADPAMETMLLHLHPLMQEHTGLELHPTYSYYRVYRPGDELKKHKDRNSCEISCTICFNFNYSDKEYTWPIFLNSSKVSLAAGDLVIYRGCDLEHWRDQFVGSEDDWHIQGFLHYVDKNGPNSSWKYDCRRSIGEITNSDSRSLQHQKNYITFTE